MKKRLVFNLQISLVFIYVEFLNETKIYKVNYIKLYYYTIGEQEIDPLGPYTPEVADAISLATDALMISHALLNNVELCIQETRYIQRDLYKSVNNGLTKKVAETVAMKVRT